MYRVRVFAALPKPGKDASDSLNFRQVTCTTAMAVNAGRIEINAFLAAIEWSGNYGVKDSPHWL